jgi:hypothetical protein
MSILSSVKSLIPYSFRNTSFSGAIKGPSYIYELNILIKKDAALLGYRTVSWDTTTYLSAIKNNFPKREYNQT